MAVADRLTELVASHPGCRVAAYADLSADMILVTNTDATLRREALDALCREAGLTLSAPESFGGPCPLAVTIDGDGARLFLRNLDVPDDVLCCVGAPDIDLAALLADARTVLDGIVGGAA